MSPDELLAEWEVRATLALIAYNRAANRCRALDTRIGGLVAILTAGIGTAVFATLEKNANTPARIAVGLVSVAAAILAGVQAFAAFPQRIEAYEKAARRFAAARRRIEEVRTLQISDADAQVLADIRRELDSVAESSINAPYRVWERTRRQIKGDFTRRERIVARLRGLPRPQAIGRGDKPEIPGSALNDAGASFTSRRPRVENAGSRRCRGRPLMPLSARSSRKAQQRPWPRECAQNFADDCRLTCSRSDVVI